jgi:hypothetical protein
MAMARKKASPNGHAPFVQMANQTFWQALSQHSYEMAYEMAKDPEIQELIERLLDRFSIVAKAHLRKHVRSAKRNGH